MESTEVKIRGREFDTPSGIESNFYSVYSILLGVLGGRNFDKRTLNTSNIQK